MSNQDKIYFSKQEYNKLMQIINDNLKREVVVNMEENYPTKRFINSDTDKYVSKSNLILYTQLLKEEITQYIDLRIAQEFEKRNL